MWVEERKEASARCQPSRGWVQWTEPGAVRTSRGRGAQPTLCGGWQVPTNDHAVLDQKTPFPVPGISPPTVQDGCIHFLLLQ